METPMYLFDELELKISTDIASFRKHTNPNGDGFKTFAFCNLYFQSELLSYFNTLIYERTQYLKHNEINTYLRVSKGQCKTHTPELRFEFVKRNFFKQYWYPETSYESKMSGPLNSFFDYVYQFYKEQFHLFQGAIEKAIQELENGNFGSGSPPPDIAVQDTQQLLPKKKLKTNLSVTQLGYLFRVIYDLKIIDVQHKTEIYNFIADNFSSKQKDDVSLNSVKNAFDTPDTQAVNFWQSKFVDLMNKAKKDQGK